MCMEKKKVAQRPMDEDMLNLQLTNRKGTFITVISVKAQKHVLQKQNLWDNRKSVKNY